MKFLCALFLSAVSAAPAEFERVECSPGSPRVVAEGFVMDQLCIDRGTLLDNPSVVSLRGPEKHSIHCLAEIARCINSGYNILSQKPGPDGLYSVQYNVDKPGTELLKNAALKAMQNGQRIGFKARVRGVVGPQNTLQCVELF